MRACIDNERNPTTAEPSRMREPKLTLPQLPQSGNDPDKTQHSVGNRRDFHPTGWNESARAIAQASRKRGSWVPSINSPAAATDRASRTSMYRS